MLHEKFIYAWLHFPMDKLSKANLVRRLDIFDASSIKLEPLCHFQNYPEVKSLLLQKGFAINTPNNKYETCLHIAAANGALAVFIELMERGANPNLRDSLGYNCLHIACKNGNINVVKYLLFRGADINACTYENNSALHICALYNASEIAELLIEKGIDQSIVNGKSKTAQAIGTF